MQNEVELLSDLEVKKAKKKILNMLSKKQYQQLKQYLALNKSEISRFSIDKAHDLLDFILNFLDDPEQLAFLNKNKDVPHELLISALNYKNNQLVESFVQCESDIDRLVKKPNYDYRGLRIEKLFQLICIEPKQVIQSMKKLVLENPNNIYISEDTKLDFKNVLQKYTIIRSEQRANKLFLKRPCWQKQLKKERLRDLNSEL